MLYKIQFVLKFFSLFSTAVITLFIHDNWNMNFSVHWAKYKFWKRYKFGADTNTHMDLQQKYCKILNTQPYIYICLSSCVVRCGLQRSGQTSQTHWALSGSTTTPQAESRPFDSQRVCVCLAVFALNTPCFVKHDVSSKFSDTKGVCIFSARNACACACKPTCMGMSERQGVLCVCAWNESYSNNFQSSLRLECSQAADRISALNSLVSSPQVSLPL